MTDDLNKKFPEEFYRGLSSMDQITEEGFIKAAAFSFPKDTKRQDGLCELSINWNDDEGSLDNLAHRRKVGSNEQQFKIGYCIVNRVAMEQNMLFYIKANKLSYERRPEEAREDNDYQENKYHGNLLMPKNIDGNLRKNIQHTLATLAQVKYEW